MILFRLDLDAYSLTEAELKADYPRYKYVVGLYPLAQIFLLTPNFKAARQRTR
jgi:hypothetical protein